MKKFLQVLMKKRDGGNGDGGKESKVGEVYLVNLLMVYMCMYTDIDVDLCGYILCFSTISSIGWVYSILLV